jgi:hypothetical protein
MFPKGEITKYGYNFASADARAKNWTEHSGLKWTTEFYRSWYLGEFWETVLCKDQEVLVS